MSEKGEITCREAGKRGGEKIKARIGKAGYVALGKQGGAVTKARYGLAYYACIGVKGAEILRNFTPEQRAENGRKGGAKVRELLARGRALEAEK